MRVRYKECLEPWMFNRRKYLTGWLDDYLWGPHFDPLQMLWRKVSPPTCNVDNEGRRYL